MKKLKKVVLLITGPGAVAVALIAIFIHIFTSGNTKPWIIGGLVIFFLVFIPLYSVEYFRQQIKNDKEKKVIWFKKRDTRTEWEGGNIHGKLPTETERPGRFFKK
jgi:preprotein translocase subunit SecY